MYRCCIFSRGLDLVTFEMPNMISAPHLPPAQGCYTDQGNLFCPSSQAVTGPGFEGQEAGFSLILFHLLISFFFLEIAGLPCVPAQFRKPVLFMYCMEFADTLNSEICG